MHSDAGSLQSKPLACVWRGPPFSLNHPWGLGKRVGGFQPKLIRRLPCARLRKRKVQAEREGGEQFPDRIFDLYVADAGPLNGIAGQTKKSPESARGLPFPAIASVKIYWLSADEGAIE